MTNCVCLTVAAAVHTHTFTCVVCGQIARERRSIATFVPCCLCCTDNRSSDFDRFDIWLSGNGPEIRSVPATCTHQPQAPSVALGQQSQCGKSSGRVREHCCGTASFLASENHLCGQIHHSNWWDLENNIAFSPIAMQIVLCLHRAARKEFPFAITLERRLCPDTEICLLS